ncbi:MAG: hypothetical protein WCK15_21695, partial [Pirellula sp.]
MSQSSKSVSRNSEELLERGRLSLRAIQYREQAALYRAEATSLQAAMLQAENGDVTSLEQWLDLKSGQFFDGVDPMASPALMGPALTSPALASPALTSPALTSPALTSPALTGPALTSPALTSPALTSPALTSPALTSPALT